MQFSQSVTEVIKSRSSWRGYLAKSIEGEVKQRLDEFLAGNRTGLFGGEARFLLVAGSEADSNVLRGLGTYGFIKGARAFIVGAVKQSEKSLEDYGYLMEKTVLFATDLGLGTCWLGGSFNKSNFSRKISAAADELVPAVAAVGYVRRKRSKRDTLIRWSVGSKK
ncbi:MAG: nitroreductase, partial [bacterium]|nr:nitroreductase [bacterium]